MGCGVSKSSCIIDPSMDDIVNASAYEKGEEVAMMTTKKKKAKSLNTVHLMERVHEAMMHLGTSAGCHSRAFATRSKHSAHAFFGHGYTLGEDGALTKPNSDATHIDEGIENIDQANCNEHEWKVKHEYSDQSTASPLNLDFNTAQPHDAYLRDLLEHYDKSTESLRMPTTLEMGTWQSKLFETLDRDIDNILLDDNIDTVAASLEKDFDGELDKYSLAIDESQYESDEHSQHESDDQSQHESIDHNQCENVHHSRYVKVDHTQYESIEF